MKKSDLKDGMVLEVREGDKFILINNLLIGNTWYELDKYNGVLINEDKHLSDKRSLDIVKIYEISDGYRVRDILEPGKEYGLELLWERKEIDWRNVTFGTKVRCWTNGDEKVEGKFLAHIEGKGFPFRIYANGHLYAGEHCELIEELVTYDEIYSRYEGYCDSHNSLSECMECKYCNDDCTIEYILQNYNVNRKEQ